jgi:hypothetical protein
MNQIDPNRRKKQKIDVPTCDKMGVNDNIHFQRSKDPRRNIYHGNYTTNEIV